MPEDTSKGLENEGTEKAEALNTDSNEQPKETQGAGEQGQADLSSEGVDISKLTPDAQKIVKGFQSSYTKKTQAIADSRKSLEAKEQQIEDLRGKYEQRLFELTQPKGKEEPLIDTSAMTVEQKSAWETLKKDRQRDINTAVTARDKEWETRYNEVIGLVGKIQLDNFIDKNPGSDSYLDKMREIQKQPGHESLPLKSLYRLAIDEQSLKKAGADEYKRNVQTKKKAVTSEPSSTAGAQADIQFKKGMRHNRGGLLKAFDFARDKHGK